MKSFSQSKLGFRLLMELDNEEVSCMGDKVASLRLRAENTACFRSVCHN